MRIVEGSQSDLAYYAKKSRRTRGAMLELRKEGRAPVRESGQALRPGTRLRWITLGALGFARGRKAFGPEGAGGEILSTARAIAATVLATVSVAPPGAEAV